MRLFTLYTQWQHPIDDYSHSSKNEIDATPIWTFKTKWILKDCTTDQPAIHSQRCFNELLPVHKECPQTAYQKTAYLQINQFGMLIVSI